MKTFIIICLALFACINASPFQKSKELGRTGFVKGSIRWLKERIENVKNIMNAGIRLQELQSLKRYLIGYDSDEVEELDREIEELLSSNTAQHFADQQSDKDFSQSEQLYDIRNLEQETSDQNTAYQQQHASSFGNLHNQKIRGFGETSYKHQKNKVS